MLKNYIKTALKVLLRRKFFTFISLFAISFTLIVLIVTSAMIDESLGAHAIERDHDRMLGVYGLRLEGPESRMSAHAGYSFLDRHVRTLPHVERVSLIEMHQQASSYVNGRKLTAYLKHTDAEFWNIYAFDFIEGSGYSKEDDVRANPVAVINESTREKFFEGKSALGKTIDLDGQRFRVIGVVRDVPITRAAPFSDVWAPIGTIRSQAYKSETIGNFLGIVVAKSPADIVKIQDEYQSRLRNAPSPDPKRFTKFAGGIETPRQFIARQMLSPNMEEDREYLLLAILLGMAVLFMLLPTVNLVNINVSRIMERSSEIGVRKAFGASSRTLVGQFIVENLVVTFAGALLAIIGSQVVLSILNATGFVLYSDFALSWRTFGYGLFFALIFGLLSGVYPALRMSRLHPVEALRGRSV